MLSHRGQVVGNSPQRTRTWWVAVFFTLTRDKLLRNPLATYSTASLMRRYPASASARSGISPDFPRLLQHRDQLPFVVCLSRDISGHYHLTVTIHYGLAVVCLFKGFGGSVKHDPTVRISEVALFLRFPASHGKCRTVHLRAVFHPCGPYLYSQPPPSASSSSACLSSRIFASRFLL